MQSTGCKGNEYPYRAFFLSAVLCLLSAGSVLPAPASAENPKEQYRKIQREIETHKEKLEQARRHERSVLEDLDGMNRRLSETEADLRRQQQRVRQTETDIHKVEKDIAAARLEIQKKKQWLKVRIKAMHRYGQSGDILFLLTSTDDMASFMRRWRYLEKISFKERRGIEEYGESLKKLDEKEKRLLTLRTE